VNTTEHAEPLISKSRFLAGLQCPKLLWALYNAKHLLPPTGAADQAILDQGHGVGELAKKLFKNSIALLKPFDSCRLPYRLRV
jgi:hypothetical protein